MEFEVSPTKKQLACFLGGGSRRLPVLHLTLLALHPWTLNVTLTYFCARRWAQYAPKTPNFGTGRNIPTKHQLSHLHHHPNCFSMSMQLTSPAEKYYEHTSLGLLIKQINDHAKTQGYAVTRKRSKHLNDLHSVSHLSLSCEWTTINRGIR